MLAVERQISLVILSLSLILTGSTAFAQSVNISSPELARASIAGVVSFADQQGRVEVVLGVPVTLTAPSPRESLSATTDAEGRYHFTGLTSGTYEIQARLEGFKPFGETIVLSDGDEKVQDVGLELDMVVEKIEVRDKVATIPTESADATTTVVSSQVTTLPLAEQKFKAALPLVPGVVRTHDGQLNFKGVPENQGMLLVDSAQTVDPVTGSFSIPVPLDAIQTMTVEKAPYSAGNGGFSGGLTTIETKAPPSHWNYGLMDFIPGLRGRSGQIVGVSSFTPRLYVGGPLIKDRLNFSEAFTYDVKKKPIRGLAWPDNETKRQGFNTLTSLQAVLSAQHLLLVSVNGFSQRTQFANISALVPQAASADTGLRGASFGANDSYQFTSGALLTTMFRYTRFDSDSHGQGPQDMLITPEGWGGHFFDAWTRSSNQFDFEPLYHAPVKKWRGSHQLSAGFALTRRSYSGNDLSHPIQILREDGTLAERIDFQGSDRLGAAETEVAEFVQDHWTLSDRFTLDLGGRLTSQSNGRSAAFAPRAAFVYAPTADRKTIIRGGAGLFYDRVPLLASDFPNHPARITSFYNSAGVLTETQSFENAYVAIESGRGMVPVRSLSTSPRNTTVNVEVDRELWRNAVVRASYLYSSTKDLYVVTPVTALSGQPSLLGMTHAGDAHYREFEATLHYRPMERSDVNVSYIRSRSRGDLNTVSGVFVPFEQPVIRPNVYSTLASDVPNRVVAWAMVSLPFALHVSPVVDFHSGLPYSSVDTLQNYVGEANGKRFPDFFSLDLKVYRELPIRLPLGKGKTKKIRVGLYSINLTNHANPLAVYDNVTSPVFGHFVGFQHRAYGFVLDAVD